MIRVLAALLLLAPGVAFAESSRGGFRVAPPPAWVVMARPGGSAESAQSRPSRYSLFDVQRRIGAQHERYTRYRRVVHTTTDVEPAAEVEMSFDPGYQRLVVHHVRVTRGDRSWDVFDAATATVLHDETDRHRRIYHGGKTLVFHVPDVRVGDIVDVAYTVVGANPVFQGKVLGSFYPRVDRPTEVFRYRVLLPRGRTLHVKNQGTGVTPTITDRGEETEWLWEIVDAEPVSRDGDEPAWYEPYPRVSLSEYSSWAQVAEWGRRLYAGPLRATPRIKELAARFLADGGDEMQRVLAASRFVQDEVRYLSLSLGPHSHMPHPAEHTLATRMGDCKDKSVLLVALLRAMGVEAYPALVDVDSGPVLPESLPSPYAFDHVVVKAVVGGEPLWIDATRSLERGPLRPLPYRYGLVLADGVSDLEAIPSPEPERPLSEVHEKWAIHETGAARLDVTTTYRGASAVLFRHRLHDGQKERLQDEFLNFYARSFPDIMRREELVAEDDEENNEIRFVERYTVPEIWNEDGVLLLRAQDMDVLTLPPQVRRSSPYSIPYPLHRRQVIEVELPPGAAVPGDVSVERVEHPAFLMEAETSAFGNRLRYAYRLRTWADHVRPEDLGRYREALDEMDDLLHHEVPRPAASTARVASPRSTSIPVLILGVLVILGGLGYMVRGAAEAVRRRARRARRWAYERGEAPARAIRCTRLQAEEIIGGLRCVCRARAFEQLDTSELTYDGRRLTSFRMRCQACGRTEPRYFEIVPSLEPL